MVSTVPQTEVSSRKSRALSRPGPGFVRWGLPREDVPGAVQFATKRPTVAYDIEELGVDEGTPVTDAYPGRDSKFTGKIGRVTVELKNGDRPEILWILIATFFLVCWPCRPT
jgi:hypothetical protein